MAQHCLHGSNSLGSQNARHVSGTLTRAGAFAPPPRTSELAEFRTLPRRHVTRRRRLRRHPTRIVTIDPRSRAAVSAEPWLRALSVRRNSAPCPSRRHSTPKATTSPDSHCDHQPKISSCAPCWAMSKGPGMPESIDDRSRDARPTRRQRRILLVSNRNAASRDARPRRRRTLPIRGP